MLLFLRTVWIYLSLYFGKISWSSHTCWNPHTDMPECSDVRCFLSCRQSAVLFCIVSLRCQWTYFHFISAVSNRCGGAGLHVDYSSLRFHSTCACWSFKCEGLSKEATNLPKHVHTHRLKFNLKIWTFGLRHLGWLKRKKTGSSKAQKAFQKKRTSFLSTKKVWWKPTQCRKYCWIFNKVAQPQYSLHGYAGSRLAQVKLPQYNPKKSNQIKTLKFFKTFHLYFLLWCFTSMLHPWRVN